MNGALKNKAIIAKHFHRFKTFHRLIFLIHLKKEQGPSVHNVFLRDKMLSHEERGIRREYSSYFQYASDPIGYFIWIIFRRNVIKIPDSLTVLIVSTSATTVQSEDDI